MKASEVIKAEVETNLGYEAVATPSEVRNGKVNYIGASDTLCVVTCTEDDEPYVRAMAEMHPELTVKVIVRKGRARPPQGKGFGDKVWRFNHEHKDGVELSFSGKPDENVRNKLKSFGFRWSHFGGVWYLSADKYAASTDCQAYLAVNFTKVENV